MTDTITDRDVHATVAELQAQVARLSEDRDRLLEAVVLLDARTTRPSPPAAPADSAAGTGPGRGWAADATGDDWTGLTEWVDWLTDTYDLLAARAVKGCWPQHPGVVEELAALRGAWTQADQDGHDAPATWHERYLSGFLARMDLYQISRCKPGTHEPVRANPTTDTAGEEPAT
jgi:hypothetical protein